jgi:hypothetical protein
MATSSNNRGSVRSSGGRDGGRGLRT